MIDTPMITAVCASYNRPKLLGQAVAMFQAQDYPNKELVILEDSGIFGETTIRDAGWRMVSTAKRWPCVGAKRNHIVRKLADGTILACWDDDDTYFPWHLSAIAEALSRGKWVQPRHALEWDSPTELGRYHVFGEPARSRFGNGNPRTPQDAMDCCYGAQWGYRLDAFLVVGGYPEGHGNGEDTRWGGEMFKRFGPSLDVAPEFPPSYVYSRAMSGSWHGSELGPGMQYHQKIGAMPKADPAEFKIELPAGYCDWTKQRIAALPVQPRKW